MSQEDVDRIQWGVPHPRTTVSLPKGMSADTLREVTQALRDGAGRSASEVAAAVGASRVTARRYLEYLAGEQVAERTVRYGGSSIPEVEYRLSRR